MDTFEYMYVINLHNKKGVIKLVSAKTKDSTDIENDLVQTLQAGCYKKLIVGRKVRCSNSDRLCDALSSEIATMQKTREYHVPKEYADMQSGWIYITNGFLDKAIKKVMGETA